MNEKQSHLLQNVGKSARIVVSLIVAFILFYFPSVLPFYYIIGSVIASITGKMLKRIIQQPRPSKSPRNGFGMPSSHTLAISFFIALIYYKLPYVDFIPNFLKQLIYVSSTVYAIVACVYRVISHLHSIEQILVGAAIGIGYATFWCMWEDDFSQIWVAPLLELENNLQLPVLLVVKFLFAALTALFIFHKDILKVLLLLRKKLTDKFS